MSTNVEFDSNVLLVALSRILERRGEACVPYLVEELQSAEWFVSCLSLTLLGDLGAEARSALLAIVAVLESARESEDGTVRRAAKRGLELLEEGAAGQ